MSLHPGLLLSIRLNIEDINVHPVSQPLWLQGRDRKQELNPEPETI